ncbi:PilW family protein [Acinetobacter nematophilus]|uniref:PilW family protein n=1 Tax=Acinetobacter nematophilus TaxID=2994642 RepID=UPI003AF667F2
MFDQRYISGFTLLELMVALSLGLIIVAAGLAVLLSSQRSLGLQSGMGELQQNANFGLSLVTYDLRHTNLNTESSQRVNTVVRGSGIVFKKENLPISSQSVSALETDLVTLESKDDDNTTGKSDRLTIQYTPQTSRIINCEGTEVTNASNKVIVQRYYLARSPQQIAGEPIAYSLYCDAGEYPKSGATAVLGLGTQAQQIMQRVDAFKVRLGVKKRNDPTNANPKLHYKFRYMTINEYLAAMANIRAACAAPITEDECSKNYLQVLSIDVGILSRSTGSIGTEANLNTQTTFNLAGTNVTLSGDETLNKKYLRQAVSQVVAIRNTLGATP